MLFKIAGGVEYLVISKDPYKQFTMQQKTKTKTKPVTNFQKAIGVGPVSVFTLCIGPRDLAKYYDSKDYINMLPVIYL